ncbi:tripartite tricarboxylate transporter substrate binding protein [Roseomonas sp. NAR14]|uniref:Tripartite tricarboxylate transporter substrate binding protein n=1 Tax=Roseomonas acroporae TaxID=2937791 RepID=A0A9X2BWZ7_9PROT|nr:tripartite tricarboxylate transporter substrate binding protein [Roseomonas acroporae]MCK8784440.1 tripartite tricarboxylate transporter substrate binding protein [Roseomonas acroporae]
MRRRQLLAASAGLLAVPTLLRIRGARAQANGAWPGRGPVRLVATFPPGGLADVIGRLVAPPLGQAIGQGVVIDNRAGAGGTIGADHVAKSPADGYTLVISHASPHGFAAGIYPQLPYDPVADFTHLGMLVDTPSVILVKGDSPFRTLDDLRAAARDRNVTYGSSGIGSSGHLLGAVMERDANLPKLTHVPYRGSAPGLQDLMAGAIDSLIDPLTTNVGMLRDGTLRALAMSSAVRVPLFPAVPTCAELGLPRMTAGNWIGLSGPRNLPAPVAERLTAEIPRLLARPELRTRFEELASYPPPQPMLGAAYTDHIARFVADWTRVARDANIVAS